MESENLILDCCFNGLLGRFNNDSGGLDLTGLSWKKTLTARGVAGVAGAACVADARIV